VPQGVGVRVPSPALKHKTLEHLVAQGFCAYLAFFNLHEVLGFGVRFFWKILTVFEAVIILSI
jgi:hypothetical protein